MNIPTKEDLQYPARRCERYIKARYPAFYRSLTNKYQWCKSWTEVLYCYSNDICEQPVCLRCGSPVKFYSNTYGYARFCGVKCAHNDKEILHKIKQTCLKRYGVENPNQSKEIQDKIKQTCLKRYGVKSTFTSDKIKEKIKQTNLKKYGVENPFASDEIKEKIKQTCLKKYGVEYSLQAGSVKEKSKQTCLKRYGVTNPMQSETFKEKFRQTMLDRYNVQYSGQSDELLKKSKQTCLKRYGVEYYCMTPECRDSTCNDSKPNRDFADLLTSNNIIYSREFPLGKYSYDFKVGNTLIEVSPTSTHNSTWGLFNSEPKTNMYHLDKSKIANESEFSCIHVWDWDDPLKVVQLITPKETIYARKCSIKEIDAKEANKFLNQYHLQGRCNGQRVCISLIYNNECVGLMTFGKPRYNKKFQWELLRLCFSKNVIGGSERLFKYFISHYNPESIISYCDKSKFSGAVYKRLGFTLKSTSGPSKHWYNIKTKQHITDNLLRQRGYDQLFNTSYGKGTSNEQLMLEHKFVEVYDCGQDSYIWKPKNEL